MSLAFLEFLDRPKTLIERVAIMDQVLLSKKIHTLAAPVHYAFGFLPFINLKPTNSAKSVERLYR